VQAAAVDTQTPKRGSQDDPCAALHERNATVTDLFGPVQAGPLTLKNRFVRSATADGLAGEDGIIEDEMFALYERLVAGGVGLIITGHMAVAEQWKCGGRQTGIFSDEHLPGLKRLAQVCKTDGSRAVVQVNYVGRKPHEMTLAEIAAAEDAFVEAAVRAERAGFDGIQWHAAHGYLMAGFITPSENERDDAYAADGRARMLVEITRRTRERVSPDFAILCKLGAVDGRDASLPLDESIGIAQTLEEAGLDALEISAAFMGSHAVGASQPGIDSVDKEAYYESLARAIKAAVNIPVILVGGLRSLEVMQRVVDAGSCDLVSLSRPLIREPDLVNMFQRGETAKAACVSCNKCFGAGGRCGLLVAQEEQASRSDA